MKIMNRNKPGLLFDIVNHSILIIFFILSIYPFYYIFIYSVSNPIEVQKGITLMPAGFTLSNYVTIFKLPDIFNATVISVLRTILGTCITILCCTLFAYLVTKKEMYFRKTIYRFLVITMYFNSGLIPWYLTMKMYHLNNNFLLYIIPSAISAFNIVLLKTFIEQIPESLEESAKLDGAGYFTIFSKIIFPLSMPIIATIAVFAAVAQWNSWFDNYILVQDTNLKTLQLVLYDYLNQANSIATSSAADKTRGLAGRQMTPETIRMTMTMLVTLPIVFVYPFMQKYFVKGIMLGAVKG